MINPSVYTSICLSASISLEALDDRHKILCADPPWFGLPLVLLYVLPVLWMTSRLAVMGATPKGGGGTQRRRSITCVTGAQSGVYECLSDDAICQVAHSSSPIHAGGSSLLITTCTIERSLLTNDRRFHNNRFP